MGASPGTWSVLKRLVRLGLPHLPLMLAVVLASSLYSLVASSLLWILGIALLGDG